MNKVKRFLLMRILDILGIVILILTLPSIILLSVPYLICLGYDYIEKKTK